MKKILTIISLFASVLTAQAETHCTVDAVSSATSINATAADSNGSNADSSMSYDDNNGDAVVTSPIAKAVKHGYETIDLMYSPTIISDHGVTYVLPISAAIEVKYAVPVKKGMPLYLQFGLGLQDMLKYSKIATYHSNGSYFTSYKDLVNLVSFYVPLNMVYHHKLNDKLTLVPYLGLRLSAIFLENRFKKFPEDEAVINDPELGTITNAVRERGLLSRDYDTFHWFNVGIQVGADIKFSRHSSVGLSYGYNFTPLRKDVHMHYTALKYGYWF